MVGAQSEFAVKFQEFVYYAGPIVQLLYWIVLAASAAYAVMLFKRWVDYRLSAENPAAAGDQVPAKTSISVDEFVE